jgi:transposase
MSAKRTDMHRIQEVVRLHRLGQGQRAIAQQLRMGRDTIRTYEEKLREAGLLEGCPDDLPDTETLKEVISDRQKDTMIQAKLEKPRPILRSVQTEPAVISELYRLKSRRVVVRRNA